MDYVADMYHWIAREYAANREPADSMERLIDECARLKPHPDWAKLRRLSYADVSPLVAWIRQVLESSPPAEPLKGLWFGMFNPIYDGEASADLYISGSERFDTDPSVGDWAAGPLPWWPEDRYAHSMVMDMIYRIAYADGGLKNTAEEPLCQGYGAFAVRAVLNRLDPSEILPTIDSAGVAVGFDSGDLMVLGRLTRDGVQPF